MTDFTKARNALAEAQAQLSDGLTARVLEPSPPAIDDGEFYADDPASLGDADGASTVLPIAGDGMTWSSQSDSSDFAEARWLGPWKSLEPVPADYVASREDFHRLAYGVVAAARHQANGKFGLRFTAGGFGTPFFANDRQVRMVSDVLVDQQGDEARQHRPTSLADAAAFLGVEISDVAAEGDSPPLGDHDKTLDLRADVGDFLGDWYGFVTSVLEELRAGASDDDQASRIQLWPGHFDPAFELGNQDAGRRATLGGSPGDDGSAAPYLYFGPWAGAGDEDYWNAGTFPGALMPYADLLAAPDARAAALEFYRTGINLLAARAS